MVSASQAIPSLNMEASRSFRNVGNDLQDVVMPRTPQYKMLILPVNPLRYFRFVGTNVQESACTNQLHN